MPRVDLCSIQLYTPIHFAVREGHVELVKYLLDNGAHDPNYKIIHLMIHCKQ
jgi:ankyrin repeat protein